MHRSAIRSSRSWQWTEGEVKANSIHRLSLVKAYLKHISREKDWTQKAISCSCTRHRGYRKQGNLQAAGLLGSSRPSLRPSLYFALLRLRLRCAPAGEHMGESISHDFFYYHFVCPWSGYIAAPELWLFRLSQICVCETRQFCFSWWSNWNQRKGMLQYLFQLKQDAPITLAFSYLAARLLLLIRWACQKWESS